MYQFADLSTAWRDRAAVLSPYAPAASHAWHEAASELERAVALYDNEVLSLIDAAAECGYSVAQLRRLIRNGTIQKVKYRDGTGIRRCDLPWKPNRATRLAYDTAPNAISLTQVARAVASGD